MVFSVIFIVFAFFSKPLFDFLYFIGPAKYLYFIIFFLSGFISWVGSTIRRGQHSQNHYFGEAYVFVFFIILYTAFIVRLALYEGGDAEEIIRKVMPFFGGLFLLSLPTYVQIKKYTVYVCSIVIIANVLIIPFSWGWIYWGGIHTFKGLYYFKTDLAFSIVLALVAFFYARDKVVDIWYVIISIASSVMIVLSNSRMNYILVGLVFIYSALSNGVTIKTIVTLCLGALVLGGTIFILYDPEKALGFDLNNIEAFTQGRNRIWDALFDVGFYKSSFSELIFGQGLNADWQISSTYGGMNQVHNAHNEVIHLLINQGVIGLILYISCWVLMIRSFGWNKMDHDARIFLCFVCFVFCAQGMSTVLSSFYQKTWWMLLAILLASYSSGNRNLQSKTGK